MDLDEILKQVPIDDIAQKFGVSPEVAAQAVKEGGAALIGGLAKNAETDEGSAAIESALSRHEGFSGATKVDDIDQADGGKIVKHVFGDKEGDVAQALNASEKTAGGIDFGKLLPMLAPIVLGLIANAKGGKAAGGAGGGGGLGDILGGLLGGGNQTAPGGGGGLGDILGGLGNVLGGGSQGGGGIGDILGGLLGGKK